MEHVLRDIRAVAAPSANGSPTVPAEVRAINLVQLAALVGCSVDELANGMYRDEARRTSAEGLVAQASEEVAFQSCPRYSAPEPAGVEVAVISLASRPSVLDSAAPKCLSMMGKQPLISHVLTQLFEGGIRRVVIVLGANGLLIRQHIALLPVAAKLRLDFVDVGTNYKDGFARSILAAAPSVGPGPFLLCTADHIFDESLVREMRLALGKNTWSETLSAIALVETDVGSRAASLPPTAVNVLLEKASADGQLITRIGKNIDSLEPSGVEAGLYACTQAVFTALATFLHKQYFTVAQAMQQLADEKKLGAVLTNGRNWFAVETPSQLTSVVNDTLHGGETSFPWQVSLLRVDSFSHMGLPGDAAREPQAQRLVLPISDATSYTSMPTNDHHAQHQAFALVPLAVAPLSALGTERALGSPLREPLLPTRTSPRHSRESTHTTHLSSPQPDGSGTLASAARLGDDGCALAIGLAPDADIGQTAYLIDLPGMQQQSKQAGGTADGLMLAVPARTAGYSLLGIPVNLLPSSVQAVKLERLDKPDIPKSPSAWSVVSPQHHTVQMTVEKQVPIFGWCLLTFALVGSQSAGAASDLQQHGRSEGDHTFLRCAWRGFATSILMVLVTVAFSDGFPSLLKLLHCSRQDALRLLSAGVAFFFNFAAFNVSLGHTSLTHAAIFESASSLWIVVGNLSLFAFGMASPVPKAHVIGILIGVLGMSLCLSDDGAQPSESAVPVSAFGDIAVDWWGNLGFIAAMKYVPAIVVAAFMLLGPFAATAEGMIVGVESMPGTLTIIGGLIIVCGSAIISVSEQASSTTFEL
ncbi:hypothetical protein AB1Y20_001037 [Prymnesium parvum]|uniref:MobA-like NTP transferase domain-containing protein n=1 Tax=Prymnesium parvum TaxID=97485 RepID=A0AB34KA89_PRYPA